MDFYWLFIAAFDWESNHMPRTDCSCDVDIGHHGNANGYGDGRRDLGCPCRIIVRRQWRCVRCSFEVGHVARAVLDAVCEVSSITLFVGNSVVWMEEAA
jgi:hypothetical protein